MGYVTNITLHHSLAEESEGEDARGISAQWAIVKEINDWLAERSLSPLKNVSAVVSGFENVVWCGETKGMFSHIAAFEEFVLGRRWQSPECVVLILQSEDEPALVSRPDHF